MTRPSFLSAGRTAAPASLGETSSGLSPRTAACLAYSTWWVSGAVMLAAEPTNRFVRFHAWQATLVFGGLWLVGITLWGLSFAAAFVSPLAFRVVALVAPLAWAMAILAWVTCLWQAGHSRWFELPWVGPWVTARTGGGPEPSGPQ